MLRAVCWVLTLTIPLSAKEPMRLPNNPSLSPDGKRLAFDWNGDIWTAATDGGTAKPLTQHPAKDRQPKWSPDGKRLAFVSERSGTPQLYVMSAEGGTPKQITFHTSGYSLNEWTPDGKLLASAVRDHAWKHADRFFIVNPDERTADVLLFDDYGQNGTLSPDGKKLLFTREGAQWWRKGYHGTQASQLWEFDRESKTFTDRTQDREFGELYPLWAADGKAFFHITGTGGIFNLAYRADAASPVRRITEFKEDNVVFPAISRDGSTIVFRGGFDLYRFDVRKPAQPVKIELFRDDDRIEERIDRRVLTTANGVSFTNDGLEIAFSAGGDIWVMDTELREPKRITFTAEEERSPIWSPDGQAIWFTSDVGGKTDLYRATRAEPKRPWWLNTRFNLERITEDGEAKSAVSFSPDGGKLAYVRNRGDFYVADADGKNAKKLFTGWNVPSYDWSPDGKWIVYAVSDADFNRDVWIRPLDESRVPFNLSRHPYNEDDPIWSPDGKCIAFVGARDDKDNLDIHYVWLSAADEEKDTYDRTLERAIEKLQKGRQTPKKTTDEEPAPVPRVVDPEPKKTAITPVKKSPIRIDFDGLHERVHRITIEHTNESNLMWSPDSKKLAFTGSVDGQTGTYTVEIPATGKPSQLSPTTGTQARWLKDGKIVWLAAGIPATMSAGGAPPVTVAPGVTRTSTRGAATAAPAASGDGYRFRAYQDVDTAKKNQAAFDMCWRTMRDRWYDEKLGNRNWNAIRAKYLPLAETADADQLQTVVQMMLGELNGSHLGFYPGTLTLPSRRPGNPPAEPTTGERAWTNITPHLGVRFVEGAAGPGLLVRDVIPGGPADAVKSKILAGERIIKIDGTDLDPTHDLTKILNGPPERQLRLTVRDAAGKDREITLKPISYTAARALLYPAWIKATRDATEKLSDGKLGYLHISAMDMPSFRKFEEALYDAGFGKEGLIIDVRENGGGSTADHLLTALTQPRHAIAVPRGGEPGYPGDRTVYATWHKPIVVLCNQNSFSNAEIFSHAIKALKRGQLVGVATAGGVISTGGVSIMDVGFLRLPFRGWYGINDGEDMELHGAAPDHVIWPTPGATVDMQLQKAVEVLSADVEKWKNRPQPKLRKATDR